MLLWTGRVHPALLAVGRDPGVLVSVSPGHGPPSFRQGQEVGPYHGCRLDSWGFGLAVFVSLLFAGLTFWR